MGLDTVELVMRIEEEFSIEILDAELSSIKTVDDLYRLVISKLHVGSSTRISNAFYRLRRAMMACLGLPRSAIRPATKLAVILPKPTRIAAWRSLAEITGLRFPKLLHPRWVRDTIRVLTGAVTIAFLAWMIEWSRPWGLLWLPLIALTGVVAVAVLNGLYAMTRWLARELPVRRVGELAESLLSLNFSEFSADVIENQVFSAQEVWLQIVHIISEQMSIDRQEIAPDSRMVEDLGIE
jgi:acyl carrier protein